MDWEGFFMDLQEEMPREGIEYDYMTEPNGDQQLIAWWGHEDIGSGNTVYLQIHKGWPEERPAGADGDHFLAFRVGTPCKDNKYRARLRDHLTEVLMKTITVTRVARDNGWDNCADGPRFPGLGCTMAFGVTTGDQVCWLVRNPNGTPDINRTIQKLRQAHTILQDVARLYRSSGEV